GEIANVIYLAPIANDSEAKKDLNAFSSVGIVTVVNVQAAQTEIPRIFDIVFATAWIDLHTTESRCFDVRALLNPGSTFSFISESL
ncbi:hypothetical protein HN011_009935, partial [Eciton burchellii]